MQNKKDLRKLLVDWDSFLKTRINEAEEEKWQPGQEREHFSSGKDDMLLGINPTEVDKINNQVQKYFDFSKDGDPADIARTKKELIIKILAAKIQNSNINPDNILIATSAGGGFEGGKGGKYIGAEKAPTSPEKEAAKGSSHKRGPAIDIYQRTYHNNPEYIIYDDDTAGLNQIVNGLKTASEDKKDGGNYSTTTNLVDPSTGESKEEFTTMNSAPLAWRRFRTNVLNTLVLKQARKSSGEGKRASMTSSNIIDIKNKLFPAIQEYPLVMAALYDSCENAASDATYKKVISAFTDDKEYKPQIQAHMSEKYPNIPWNAKVIEIELSVKNVQNRELARQLINAIGESSKKLDLIQHKFLDVKEQDIQKGKVNIYDFDNTLVNTAPILAALGIAKEDDWKFLSYMTFLKEPFKEKLLKSLIARTEPIKIISDKFVQDLEISPQNTFIVSKVGTNPLRVKVDDVESERPVTGNDFILWFRQKDPDLLKFLSRGVNNTAAATSIKKMPDIERPARTAAVDAPKFGRDQYIAKYAEDQNARKYLIDYLTWYGNPANLSSLSDQQIADLEKSLKFVRGLPVKSAAAKQAFDSETEGGLDALLKKVDAAMEQRNQADESQYEDGEEYDPDFDSDLRENKVKKVKSLRENVRPIRLRMVGH